MHKFSLVRKSNLISTFFIIAFLILSSIVVLIDIPSVQAETVTEGLGNNHIGEFVQSRGWNSIDASIFVANHSGTLTGLHWYGKCGSSANGNLTVHLNSTGGSLLNATVSFTETVQWYNATGLSLAISDGVAYRFGIHHGALTADFRYDNGTDNQYLYKDGGVVNTPSVFPAPTGYEDWEMSIYADIEYEGESESYPITFTSPSTNSSTPNSACQFSATRTTNASNGYHWFESNITTTMVNGTATEFTGNGTSSFTETLPNDNCTVQWRINGNTTSGEYASDWQNLTVQTVYYVVAASGNVLDIQAANDAIVAHNVWYPQNNGKYTLGHLYIPGGTWDFWNGTQQALNKYPAANITDGVYPMGAGYSNLDAQGIPQTFETILRMPYSVYTGAENAGNYSLMFNLGRGGSGFSLFNFDVSRTNKTIRFSGIKLVGYRTINESNTDTPKGIEVFGLTDFRIDHCVIENLAGGAINMPLYYEENSYTCGVIDHCKIYNTAGINDLANYANGNVGYGVSVQRSYHLAGEVAIPYDSDSTVLGQYTNYTTFIEDCYFSKWRHCVASGHGGYYVFRRNIINEDFRGTYSLDVHGLRDSEVGRAGGRGAEIYDNILGNQTYTGTNNSTAANKGIFQIGGGSGVFFNNTIDTTYLNMQIFEEDYVDSEVWHLKNFYFWGALGGLSTPTMTSGYYLIDASRNVTASWAETQVNASWSIAGYEPYAYPHYLTLDNGEPPTFTYVTEVSSVSPEESSTLESSTLNFEFTTTG
ncbi:MAG: hypothetical protein WC325_10440, partial [Candidatus Bathyarchaeia archaeon]